jgi:hypothetical protein
VTTLLPVDDSLFFPPAVRLADCRWNVQFQYFVLLQSDPQHVAAIAQKAKDEANFLVDVLGRRLLAQPVTLVVLHNRFADLDGHLIAKQSICVPDCVFRERHGAVTKPVINQVVRL